MTDSDVFAFADVVRGLERVFPKRLDEHEKAQLQRDYFKALRRFPLSQVEAGADVWLQRGKFFPKPAEWIDAIPTRAVPVLALPVMSESDARIYARAEALRYEDAPCSCAACRQAGVEEKPLRFVPDDPETKAIEPQRDRVVLTGHWAHGEELARWYRARADFYEAFARDVSRRGL